MKDKLFKKPLAAMAGFEFNQEVAAVFDDMLVRSIPFYREIQLTVADLANRFYQAGTCVYDLGCSTGGTMACLLETVSSMEACIGVDNSPAMLEKARARFAERPQIGNTRIELLCEDIRTFVPYNASVIVMNYTLQFVRPINRPEVLARLYDCLAPGGALILSEKVIEEDPASTKLFQDIYFDFKRSQGYSDMEISQKREKLEHVLVPYHLDEQLALLKQAGFARADLFFKWHNFASFLAVK